MSAGKCWSSPALRKYTNRGTVKLGRKAGPGQERFPRHAKKKEVALLLWVLEKILSGKQDMIFMLERAL